MARRESGHGEVSPGGAGWQRVSERPLADFTTGPVTRVLRWVSVATPFVASAVLLLAYPSLPEVVPTHFGVTGEADAWGPRWSVLVMVAVWLLLAVGIAVLSRFPRVFNYPVPVTEENAQPLYREAERMLVWLAASMSLVFGAISAAVLGADATVFVVLGLAATFVAMVVGIVRMLSVADARTGSS